MPECSQHSPCAHSARPRSPARFPGSASCADPRHRTGASTTSAPGSRRDPGSAGRPAPSACPRLHDIPAVADILGVGLKTVRRWIADGALVTHRFGRQIRISEADLAAFIKLHRHP